MLPLFEVTPRRTLCHHNIFAMEHPLHVFSRFNILPCYTLYILYICTCAIFQLVLYYIYTYIRTKKWETWKYEVNIIISWFRTFAVGRRRAVGVLREAPQLLRLAPLLLRLQPSAGASHVLGAIAWAISATGP